MNDITIYQLTTKDELMGEFVPILSYWNKKGLVRFIPIFGLYKEMDKGRLHLLKLDGGLQTVGILWLTPRQRPYKFIKIEVFALHYTKIGVGLGGIVWNTLINGINQRYGLPIELDVMKDNERALNFYLKHGFVIKDMERGNGRIGLISKCDIDRYNEQ